MEIKISSRTVYEGGVITVTQDEVKTPSGRTAGRDVVHHGGGAGVIALNDKGEIYLIKQFRYAVGKELIEIPAGKLDAGEDPKVAAVRELEEEAGIRAENIIHLGDIIPTCGYCNEVIYVYGATGLSHVAQNLDEDEIVSIFTMPLTEAVDAVLKGDIVDGKTVFAILALNERLRRNDV